MEKKLQCIAEFLREALAADFRQGRVSATSASPSEGECFVITVEKTRVYGVPFAGIPRDLVLSRLSEGQALRVGEDRYWILGSFRDRFATLLEECATNLEACEDALTVTVESRSGLQRFYGIDVDELTSQVLRCLPEDLVVIRTTEKTRDSRERGRKIGGAAKDLAALRPENATLEKLLDPGASGFEEEGEGDGPGVKRPRPGGKPLPARRKRSLEEIRREGPPVSAVGPEDLLDRFGFTGLEFGNWVAQEEGRRHVILIAGAFQDLEEILGLEVRPFTRSGDLALALGSRGKGSACAHYEPGKRVINLTRLTGDGSVAHEFAHFLDHLMGLRYGLNRYAGPSLLACPFLSEDDYAVHSSPPPHQAMDRLMEVIQKGEVEEMVTSKATDRWHDRDWLLRWLEEAGGDPQAGLDRICLMYGRILMESRNAREKSMDLVDSMAKWLGRPLTLRIRYQTTTRFVEEARALGGYWRKRRELFARAFESFVEDELVSHSRCNEYLVEGTRKDFEGYRGCPYPRGEERLRIHRSLREFLATLKD